MKHAELIDCPLCSSNETTGIVGLVCGNFDNSSLYQVAKITACEKCGHIYNKLTSKEIEDLINYYNEEYAQTNIGATDKTGDRPGSKNLNSFKRYDQLFELISPYLKSDSEVLDIGCAMGGFLDYLSKKNINNLSGIDVAENYINYAKINTRYNIKQGYAESLPFNDKSFNIVVIDQVLEHSFNPIKVFNEAKRVLINGGVLCIGVPDASKYGERYFFDFYWFIMREHIQHFDIEHLRLIAEDEGFELVSFSKSETPMMSEAMILPNLNVIFRLTNNAKETVNKNDLFRLQDSIRNYIVKDTERLNKKREFIGQIKQSQKGIYIWGIGREFLYLCEQTGLKDCNIVALIDANPYKQSNATVNGRSISNPSILKKAPSDSAVLITAVAHKDTIKKSLKDMGYKGEVIEV